MKVPFPTVEVDSLEQLKGIEREAVRRLNDSPQAAELFLLDPVGSLALVGIVIAPEVIRQWGALIGGTLPTAPPKTRDLIARSAGAVYSTGTLKITLGIRGILPPSPSSPSEA